MLDALRIAEHQLVFNSFFIYSVIASTTKLYMYKVEMEIHRSTTFILGDYSGKTIN